MVGSGFEDCKGLNGHNFLNACPNGANKVSIVIYVSHDNGRDACENQKSHKGITLFRSCFGFLSPTAKVKCLLGSNSW